jgi:hypothetical protein
VSDVAVADTTALDAFRLTDKALAVIERAVKMAAD